MNGDYLDEAGPGLETSGLEDQQDFEVPDQPYRFHCPKQLLGRGGKRKRADLANRICQMITGDTESRSGLADLADQVDELYLGREVESLTPLWDDAPTYNAQTLHTSCEDLVAYVVGPMVASDPFFVLRAGGPKGNPTEQVQTVLHFFLSRGGWDLELDAAADLVVRRGRCPMRVQYIPGRPGRSNRMIKPAFEFEAIDTRFTIGYPSSARTVEDMRTFGHIAQCRAQEIAERQKDKRYFDDVKILAGADRRLTMGDQAGDMQPSTSNAVYPEDDPVDYAVVLHREDLDQDGHEELYLVVVALQQQALLLCEEFQIDRVNYADYFFERETGRYFPESSVGTRLVGPHHFVNDMLNLQVWLSTYAAAPPMYGEDWALPDEVIRGRPGEVTPVDSGTKLQIGGGQVNLTAFPGLYELALRMKDAVSGVTQTGQGSQFAPSTTATAANQAWQGQMTGIAAHTRKFSYGAVQTARIVMEYLYENFEEWYPAYSDVLPSGLTRDDFDHERYWIEVNGETPNTTPQAILQQITLFLQALAPALQAQPDLLTRYPDLIPGLVRAFLESSTVPGKESILPTREEEAQQEAMKEQINAALAAAQGGGQVQALPGPGGAGSPPAGGGAQGEPGAVGGGPDVPIAGLGGLLRLPGAGAGGPPGLPGGA